MTSASQGHKLQVRGINSEGIMAPIADVAIADVANDTTGAITQIKAALAFSNAAAVNTNNLNNIVYTFSSCPGLTIASDTGYIDGTPTTNGVYKCVVVASVDGAAVRSNIFTITIADPAAALTGTAITGGVTEAEVVAGDETIIITLTADTWAAAGTGPIGSTANTQAIIDGLTAAASPTNGWNNEVRDKEVTTAVVRTSDTVCTITLTAQAGYSVTADETVTATIPAAVLTISASAVVATPTVVVTATA